MIGKDDVLNDVHYHFSTTIHLNKKKKIPRENCCGGNDHFRILILCASTLYTEAYLSWMGIDLKSKL